MVWGYIWGYKWRGWHTLDAARLTAGRCHTARFSADTLRGATRGAKRGASHSACGLCSLSAFYRVKFIFTCESPGEIHLTIDLTIHNLPGVHRNLCVELISQRIFHFSKMPAGVNRNSVRAGSIVLIP